jgi:hypothetical protein
LTLPIPLPGTPYFDQCAAEGRFLPNVRLRDLDGWVLVMHPHDPIPQVAQFLTGMPTMRGYGTRVLKHASGFARRYWRTLSALQIMVAMHTNLLLAVPALGKSPSTLFSSRRRWPRERTFIATTEALDDVYQPFFPVAWKYRHYFQPVMVSDNAGNLSEDMAELAARPCSRQK